MRKKELSSASLFSLCEWTQNSEDLLDKNCSIFVQKEEQQEVKNVLVLAQSNPIKSPLQDLKSVKGKDFMASRDSSKKKKKKFFLPQFDKSPRTQYLSHRDQSKLEVDQSLGLEKSQAAANSNSVKSYRIIIKKRSQVQKAADGEQKRKTPVPPKISSPQKAKRLQQSNPYCIHPMDINVPLIAAHSAQESFIQNNDSAISQDNVKDTKVQVFDWKSFKHQMEGNRKKSGHNQSQSPILEKESKYQVDFKKYQKSFVCREYKSFQNGEETKVSQSTKSNFFQEPSQTHMIFNQLQQESMMHRSIQRNLEKVFWGINCQKTSYKSLASQISKKKRVQNSSQQKKQMAIKELILLTRKKINDNLY